MSRNLELSVVVPVFNEADGVALFLVDLRRTLQELEMAYEVVMVDDGSLDNTIDEARNVSWPELRIIELTRNLGHQNALMVGMTNARGEWVITMDGDGQHPADLIPELIDTAISTGVSIVYAVREQREEDKFLKKFMANIYYRSVRLATGIQLKSSQADFRLVHRNVVTEIAKVKGDPILRVLIPKFDFKSTSIAYTAKARIAGDSKFQLNHQVKMATSSVINYSTRPLLLSGLIGVSVSLLSLIWLMFVVAAFVKGESVDGWASVMSAVLFIGGMMLIGLAIIGAYVARIFEVVSGLGGPHYSLRTKTSPVHDPDSR